MNNRKSYYYHELSSRPNAAEEICASHFNGEKTITEVFRVNPAVKNFTTFEET